MKKFLVSFLLSLITAFGFAQGYTASTDVPIQQYDIGANQPFEPWLDQLRDNFTIQPVVVFGSGNWIPVKADQNHEVSARINIYPEPQWDFILDTFKVYFNLSGTNVSTPTEIFVIKKSSGLTIKVGEFGAGTLVNGWNYIPLNDTNRVAIRQIIVVGGAEFGGSVRGLGNIWGSEWKLSGRYKNLPRPEYARAKTPWKYANGMNTFWWDFILDVIPNTYDHEVTAKTNRYIEMGIKTARFFIWEDYIEAGQDTFSFQPAINEWFGDTVLNICKRRGIDPIWTIMGIPVYQQNTWPDPWAARPRTTDYAHRDDRHNPASFARIARTAFVIAARYGRNTAISPSLMGTIWTNPHSWVPKDSIRIGLGLLNYIEILNEPDLSFYDDPMKFYHYLAPEMYGAYLSAVYDGHKGTIDVGFGPGVGVGIKTADSTMKVVVGALSIPSTSAYLGIVDWCRRNRGLKANGEVDLPFDIGNWHDYSKDAVSQFGGATTGMPPELSGFAQHTTEFIANSKYYTQGKEFWITEYGYDNIDSSRFSTPAIPPYDKYTAAGIWDVRTRLVNFAFGTDRQTWFKVFADDTTVSVQFADMKLVEQDNVVYKKMAVGDFMTQTKIYGDYLMDSIRSFGYSRGAIWCLKLKRSDGRTVYPVWGVESTTPFMRKKFIPGTDSAGYHKIWSYNFINVTGIYRLYLPNNPLIRIKYLKSGSNFMDSTALIQVTGGYYDVAYGMSPTFVEAYEDASPPPDPGSRTFITTVHYKKGNLLQAKKATPAFGTVDTFVTPNTPNTSKQKTVFRGTTLKRPITKTKPSFESPRVRSKTMFKDANMIVIKKPVKPVRKPSSAKTTTTVKKKAVSSAVVKKATTNKKPVTKPASVKPSAIKPKRTYTHEVDLTNKKRS